MAVSSGVALDSVTKIPGAFSHQFGYCVRLSPQQRFSPKISRERSGSDNEETTENQSWDNRQHNFLVQLNL